MIIEILDPHTNTFLQCRHTVVHVMFSWSFVLVRVVVTCRIFTVSSVQKRLLLEFQLVSVADFKVEFVLFVEWGLNHFRGLG